MLRSRDPYDYGFTGWVHGPTALTPDQLPDLCLAVRLDSVRVPAL